MKVKSAAFYHTASGPCISKKLEEEAGPRGNYAMPNGLHMNRGYFWISALLSENRRDDGRNYLGTEIGNHHIPCSSMWKDKSDQGRSGGRDDEARHLSTQMLAKRGRNNDIQDMGIYTQRRTSTILWF